MTWYHRQRESESERERGEWAGDEMPHTRKKKISKEKKMMKKEKEAKKKNNVQVEKRGI